MWTQEKFNFEPKKKKPFWKKMSINFIERYFYLICFATYAKAAAKRGSIPYRGSTAACRFHRSRIRLYWLVQSCRTSLEMLPSREKASTSSKGYKRANDSFPQIGYQQQKAQIGL